MEDKDSEKLKIILNHVAHIITKDGAKEAGRLYPEHESFINDVHNLSLTDIRKKIERGDFVY